MAVSALAFAGAARSEAAGYFAGKHYPIVTDAEFPADEFILEQARFWFAIYVEVGDDEGLLHDPFYPDLVFRKVRAPGQGRATSKVVEGHVHALQDEIRALLGKDSASLTPQERELKAIFPSFWDSTGIMLSAQRIRFQRGLKGKYRAGLERSYRYLPLIDSTLAAEGVPSRLKFLPHVESSFYPFAYSKVGAAGMWQFMKSSARHFKLKVGYQVDERRDPHASTQAAARMLAGNHASLKSWPLAVMAYNHGPSGVAKAVRQSGTSDLGTIIKSYYSSSFGFASKNFYAEFLAASSIALKADSLFPDLRKMEPLSFRFLTLSKPLATRYLCTVTGMSPEELEEYNLGLRPATFRGNGQLPKGFKLRLPLALDVAAIAGKLGGVEIAARGGKPGIAVAAASASQASGTPSEAAQAADSLAAPALAMTMPQDKVENVDEEAAVPAPSKAEKPKRGGKEKKAPAIVAQASIGEAGSPAAAPTGIPAPQAPASLPAPAVAASGKSAPSEVAPVPQAAVVKSIAPAPAKPVPVSVASASQTAMAAQAAPVEHLVDSALGVQASDMDKLAHPMDRFNPAIYNLEYTYADGTLSFQAGTEETLSHYAEWAWVPERTLRTMNRIRNPKDFRMGRKIRIPLGEEKTKEFLKRREENYRAIEEDFYGSYYVSVTEPLVVEKGLNLWTWAQEKEIPFWLLQKHNPGKALNALHPGDTLNLPVIETGNRKWGFTRYGSSREYLAGISRFLASGKPEAY
ncbi:MAG: transglycosylase SLT domain-containing protein [Fibrobacteria bacterium]